MYICILMYIYICIYIYIYTYIYTYRYIPLPGLPYAGIHSNLGNLKVGLPLILWAYLPVQCHLWRLFPPLFAARLWLTRSPRPFP